MRMPRNWYWAETLGFRYQQLKQGHDELTGIRNLDRGRSPLFMARLAAFGLLFPCPCPCQDVGRQEPLRMLGACTAAGGPPAASARLELEHETKLEGMHSIAEAEGVGQKRKYASRQCHRQMPCACRCICIRMQLLRPRRQQPAALPQARPVSLASLLSHVLLCRVLPCLHASHPALAIASRNAWKCSLGARKALFYHPSLCRRPLSSAQSTRIINLPPRSRYVHLPQASLPILLSPRSPARDVLSQ
ncbi:hypothetical protein DFH27DRAFT_149880 [Peziza echinospora]|nr:hypothetical protein DFH27DRAFT_149880 [Peziza echinospora]